MTMEAGSQGIVPSSVPAPPQSEADETAGLQQPEPDGRKRERPKNILELLEYAYGESGRKLNLARRDLWELRVDSAASQVEIEAVRRLAADDPFLAVPPNLLATLADLGAEPPVRQRLLELVLAALASHKLFEGQLERLADATVQPQLTAREISQVAKRLTADELGLRQPSQLKDAVRERLRVNAVTAFELFRVLRDGWTVDQFVDDMCALVWDMPALRGAPKVAAVLVTAKNTDAFSQLSRHFEARLRDSSRETGEARAHGVQQLRRAEAAEALSSSLAADLAAEHERVAVLQAQIADLTQRLADEQSGRVVDKSHLVDDREALRTQVIRRLTAQAELLSDGLHALRNGSTGVAEEFVDRALTAIDGEVTRLKDLAGGAT